ncbi:FxLD family lanthipeptide [Streptomyces sp. NPDC085665]|uniref:FxLD family lanthipeptide n=1 Tax=Streptomyces sp. NPDC085665 TaxID=3365735 RepID=UPI0037D84621
MAMMTSGAANPDDAFDLDVTLVDTALPVSLRDASEGGCGSTCSSNSCTSGLA